MKDNTDFNNFCKLVLLVLLAVFLWILYNKNWCCNCCCNNYGSLNIAPIYLDKDKQTLIPVIKDKHINNYPNIPIKPPVTTQPLKKIETVPELQLPKIIYDDDIFYHRFDHTPKTFIYPIFIEEKKASVNAPGLFTIFKSEHKE